MSGHLYKSVRNKLNFYQVVVEKFINNNKKFNEFTSVSVSKVIRELKRVERECLLINFTTREL
jgi:hypothetical protein